MSNDLPSVHLLVEGPTDRVIVQQVMRYVGLPVGKTFGEKGKDHLLDRIAGYNHAARISPWVAVVDLDQKPDCAPLLLTKHLPSPSKGMRFRVAVRAIEAWLLADVERLAAFLHVRETQIPVTL